MAVVDVRRKRKRRAKQRASCGLLTNLLPIVQPAYIKHRISTHCKNGSENLEVSAQTYLIWLVEQPFLKIHATVSLYHMINPMMEWYVDR